MTADPNSNAFESKADDAQLDNLTEYERAQQLKEDYLSSQPLVGKIQSLSHLTTLEFCDQMNFKRQIQSIVDFETHSGYRQMRRDGDCFYRSFLLGLFETIEVRKDLKLVTTICEIVTMSLFNLLKYGFEQYTLEDFYYVFLDELNFYQKKIEEGDSYQASDGMGNDAVTRMANDGHTNYLIFWARMLASLHIRDHQSEFAPYIPNGKSFAEWLRADVEALHSEADHIQFTALSQAIQVPITIICLENNEDNSGPSIVHSIPANADTDTQTKEPLFDLLYRPGHYDLLYRADAYKEKVHKLEAIANTNTNTTTADTNNASSASADIAMHESDAKENTSAIHNTASSSKRTTTATATATETELDNNNISTAAEVVVYDNTQSTAAANDASNAMNAHNNGNNGNTSNDALPPSLPT